MDPHSSPAHRVFIADDHPIVLDGISTLIHSDPRLELVGHASDGASALERILALQPDIAVLDLSMPGRNGIDVTNGLRAAGLQCRIVMLTVQEDAAYVRQAMECGVAGYVLKRSATGELLRAIQAVLAGHNYLDPAIVVRAVGLELPRAAAPATDEDLSLREGEVVKLIATGHSNKAVANMLRISSKSVDTYKMRAMAKLGIKSRVEIVRFALQQGWIGKP